MKNIKAIVSRGNHRNKVVTPHRYKEGHYLVAKRGNTLDSRKKVFNLDELMKFVQLGYSIRMSAQDVPPSLYCPESLIVE